ncbi:hypothetical protein ACGVWS_13515 [Enterobacteriaceae bacterium LUAb1]
MSPLVVLVCKTAQIGSECVEFTTGHLNAISLQAEVDAGCNLFIVLFKLTQYHWYKEVTHPLWNGVMMYTADGGIWPDTGYAGKY